MAKYPWKARHQNDGLRVKDIVLFRTDNGLEKVATLMSFNASVTMTNGVSGTFELLENYTPWDTTENFLIGLNIESRKTKRKIMHTHHHVRITGLDGNIYSFVGRKGFTRHG